MIEKLYFFRIQGKCFLLSYGCYLHGYVLYLVKAGKIY